MTCCAMRPRLILAKMKRGPLIWFSAGIAAVLIALPFILPPRKAPAEMVCRSEALLSAKVKAYHQQPSPTTLALVRVAIANHRNAIEQSRLTPDAREALERSLYEQINIVR